MLDHRVRWTQIDQVRIIPVLLDKPGRIENRFLRTTTGPGNDPQMHHFTHRNFDGVFLNGIERNHCDESMN
jgi:hypothetical protein